MTSSPDRAVEAGPSRAEPGTADPAGPVSPRLRSFTRVAVGAVGALADQATAIVDAAAAGAGQGPPTASTGGGRARDIAVGAVFEAQEVVGGGLERVGSVVSPWTRWIWGSPIVRPVRREVDRRLDELAERGAREQVAGRELTAGVVDGTVARVAASEALPATVDQVVGGVLPGILDSALPVAIDKLGEQPELIEGLVNSILGGILDAALPVAIDKLGDQPELIEGLVGKILDGILDAALPEAIGKLSSDPDLLLPVVVSILPVAIDAMGEQQDAIREIVRSSSDSITTEVANTVRSRTVRGDDVVERIARRLTLRKTRPVLGPHEDLAGALSTAPAPPPVAELGAGPAPAEAAPGRDGSSDGGAS